MNVITQILSQGFGRGLVTSQKMKGAFWGSVNLGISGAVIDMALVGFQAHRAGRGGLIPSIVGQSVVIGAGVPIAGFAAAGLCLIPGIGPVAAAFLAEAIMYYPEYRVGSALITAFRTFSNLHKNMRHLEMGGSYQDSELAQRQRMIALQDMNASMIPGRRFLGNEARLMNHL